MNYESSRQAADRLGVSIHTLQKWAREDRIPGAERHGRSWMIPVDFVPADRQEAQPKCEETQITNDGPLIRVAMPLMNSAYPVGKCREFIEAIPDKDDRAIAWGEYYYYCGQAERAARTMEPYQVSAEPVLRYSANLVGFFANFTRGDAPLAMRAFERLLADLRQDLQSQPAPLLRAIGALAVTTASVLLHLPVASDVDLQQCISCLPDGLKLWACYLLAHRSYLDKDYSGSLAMAELALFMSPKLYPVPAIYVHLVAAMDLISLKRV